MYQSMEYKARFVGYEVTKIKIGTGKTTIAGYDVKDLKTGKPLKQGFEGSPYLWGYEEVTEFLKRAFDAKGMDW